LGFKGFSASDFFLFYCQSLYCTQNQQDIAQALSARINEAYQSLLNPLSRAEYLLQRHHIPVSETDQLEDMELMGEVIEARETIEDAEDSHEINVLVNDNQGL
jgi:molecular chaperone HscB